MLVGSLARSQVGWLVGWLENERKTRALIVDGWRERRGNCGVGEGGKERKKTRVEEGG